MPLAPLKKKGPGLATRRALAQVKEELEDIDYTIKQDAMDRLTKAQLRLIPRPSEDDGSAVDPRLPPNISVLTSQELGALHGQFCAMIAYASTRVALADIDHTIRKEALDFARTKLILNKDSSSKLYVRRAEAEVDEHMQKLNREEMVSNATYTLMQSVYESYVTGKEACSREITRRTDLESREPR